METFTSIEISNLPQIISGSNSSSSISFNGGQLVGSNYLWGWELGSSGNLSTETNNNQITTLGNVIIGNGQWIIGEDNTPDKFSSMLTDFVTRKLDSVIFKLQMRLPASNTDNPSENGNPFADGRNPFGEGNMPELPALDYLKSLYGENFPIGAVNSDVDVTNNTDNGTDNPFAGGNSSGDGSNPFGGDGIDNPFVGSESSGDGSNPFGGDSIDNPFVGSESSGDGSNPFGGDSIDNPFVGGSGVPQQSSFDISKLLLGNNSSLDVSGDGTTLEISDILSSVQANILNITSSVEDLFANGNTTPLQNPSDLLRLFRADMYSFNSGIDAVSQLAASDSSDNGSNPFASLFAGGDSFGDVTDLFASLFADSNSSANSSNPFGTLLASGQEQIPFDIITTALEGILPFSGSDNVFTTPGGEIPIGYSNKDFGSDNAVIGNANWDYGNFNATIGNGNWHWDASKDNATIGNGNWYLDNSKENETVGNGNWYWESTADNVTLGNGNWHFGNNNTTIGNGNWDFGSNNTIIGNGNWVFTSNSIVIGNGNWSVIIDKAATGADEFLDNVDSLALTMGIKDATATLVNSLVGQFATAFGGLTGDLSESGQKTYDKLFLGQDTTIAAAPAP